MDKAFGAPALITLFQSGHAGVDLFFAISGFIILFVHRQDIGRPSRLGRYLSRRFKRVMPLYWVALAATVVMGAAGSHAPPSAVTLVWAATLLPTVNQPLLGIAWTLQFEIVFYGVFAVLIVNRMAGAILIGGWFAWIAAAALGLHFNQVPGALCGIYGLEFLMGMAAAYVVNQSWMRRPWSMALAGLALFVTMMVMESAGLADGFAASARLVYGPAAALLIAGLATVEQGGGMRVPLWLQRLGGASYSIYLFQFIFIGPVWQAWLKAGLGHPGTRLFCFFALAAAALIGGLLVSRLVEQPLLSLTRRRTAKVVIPTTAGVRT